MEELKELYCRHRPKLLKGLIGQDDVVKTVKGFQKTNSFPHAIVLAGPSGTGKTTTARILKDKLECSDEDFHELNCARERGIDMVREMGQTTGLAAWNGKNRMWLLDEAGRLTPDAQSGLLKMLEDPLPHCYFLLATTDPEKLLKTIRTRCTPLTFKSLTDDQVTNLVRDVAGKENKDVPDSVVRAIVEAAEGSARMALVLLNQVIDMDDEKDQCNAIVPPAVRKQSIDLCRALLERAGWNKIAAILNSVDDSELDKLRRGILGYARACMLKNAKPAQCYSILCAFEANFFDSGNAGLARACWEASSQK